VECIHLHRPIPSTGQPRLLLSLGQEMCHNSENDVRALVNVAQGRWLYLKVFSRESNAQVACILLTLTLGDFFRDWGHCGSASLYKGLEAEPQVGVQGQSPQWGSWVKPHLMKLKAL